MHMPAEVFLEKGGQIKYFYTSCVIKISAYTCMKIILYILGIMFYFIFIFIYFRYTFKYYFKILHAMNFNLKAFKKARGVIIPSCPLPRMPIIYSQ